MGVAASESDCRADDCAGARQPGGRAEPQSRIRRLCADVRQPADCGRGGEGVGQELPRGRGAGAKVRSGAGRAVRLRDERLAGLLHGPYARHHFDGRAGRLPDADRADVCAGQGNGFAFGEDLPRNPVVIRRQPRHPLLSGAGGRGCYQGARLGEEECARHARDRNGQDFHRISALP